jgi:hypothetical protein
VLGNVISLHERCSERDRFAIMREFIGASTGIVGGPEINYFARRNGLLPLHDCSCTISHSCDYRNS